jgi:alpha-galactosidase
MTVEYCFIKYKTANDKCNSVKFNLNNDYSNEDFSIKIIKKKITNGLRFNLELNTSKELIINDIQLICTHVFNKDDRIFVNGYQSWSESKEFGINDKIKGFNRFLNPIFDFYKIKNFGDACFFKYPCKRGQLHGYTYTYIRQKNNFKLMGSLDETCGFTIFIHKTGNHKLIIKKDISDIKIDKKYKAFDLLFAEGFEKDVFEEYFKNLNSAKIKSFIATGWTSWYYHYKNISEKIILDNLKSFKDNKIPIDFFQIDDGYQKAIGDWLDIKDTFPNGMGYVADKIRKSGLKPGIWIAPFICQERSNMFKDHNDWIVKDDKGNPFKLGYSKGYWNDNFYPMNFYNRDFQDYINDVFKTITNIWKYDLIKIDFLYALGFCRNNKKPKALIIQEAMEFLRKILDKKLILGCGVTLANAFGLVDYCRIGSDVALTWENDLYKMIHYRERVSTVNSLNSTIFRRHLNGRVFNNDPDVYILRDENNSLTIDQRYTMFLINQIFGNLLFTSDNINNYNERTLTLYKSQFPVKGKEIVSVDKNKCDVFDIVFKIGSLTYRVFSNFGKTEFMIDLDDAVYFNGSDKKFVIDKSILLKPYQSICFLKLKGDKIELAGCDLHLFPCSFVDIFKVQQENITIRINPKVCNTGNLFIKVPDEKLKFKINGKAVKAKKMNGMNILVYKI